MRIALVHDWLNQKAGGAEKVLGVMAEMFPDAPIYTLIHNPAIFDFPPERIRTSYLQNSPGWAKRHSRYLLPFIPSAVEAWDFSGFDLVLSSSSAFVKNINVPENTKHICYCHTPMRFVWDYWPKYLDEQQVGPLRRAFIRNQVKKLRIWDYVGSNRVDVFVANSGTTQARIKKFYNHDSEIIFPPVDIDLTSPDKKADYYVTLGMLTPYKKIDLAIESFNISGKSLKIIGDGPDRKRLEAMAEDNIEFTGFIDSEQKDRLLTQAKGLVFPNIEDFGIAPVEAMACGTPVIGYNRGGVTETVEPGVSGILFDAQTPEALNQAVDICEKTRFDTSALHRQAEKFNRQRFEVEIRNLVESHG